VIDAVLERAGITDCFATTVSGEEVAAGKPAPDVYLAATRRLGVDPTDAAAVEDSTNGLRAAAAAGMVVIASPKRRAARELSITFILVATAIQLSVPSLVVSRPSEVAALIDALVACGQAANAATLQAECMESGSGLAVK